MQPRAHWPTATYSLSATSKDVAGNMSDTATELAVIVDTSAPAPPVIVGIDEDTGSSSSDGVTSDNTLIISGTAEPESIVAVSEAVLGVIGSTIADATGNWSLDATASPLADGAYSFSATSKDVAGNMSDTATELAVIVDTSAPAPPVIVGIDEDTGSSSSDGVTSDNTLIISGTAEPESIVAVREAVLGVIGSTIADATGNWSLDATATTLADGAYSFSATAEDVAGNISDAATELAVIVDTSAPLSPTLALDPAFDSAPLGDSQTTFDTVTLVGTTEPNAVVELLETGDMTTADPAGNFAFVGVALVLGANEFNVSATDLAGNQVISMATITRLDDGIDGDPPVIELELANDTGIDSTDRITTDAAITGTVSDESDFELAMEVYFQRVDEFVLVELTELLDGSGSFTLPSSFFASLYDGFYPYGTYELTLQAVDEFGNEATVRLDIGHQAFVGEDVSPPELAVQIANDTGPDPGDGFTTDPTVIGSVSDPSDVSLFLDLYFPQTDEYYDDDISSVVNLDGTFTINQSLLESQIGRPLPYGVFEVYLIAEDTLLNTSYADVTVGFEASDGSDVFPPQLNVALANPTGFYGYRATDPTLIGSVTDVNDFTLSMDVFVYETSTPYHDDVTAQVAADGSLILDVAYFETLISSPLPTGAYDVTLQAVDTIGNAATTYLPFALVGPGDDLNAPNLLAYLANDTGPDTVDLMTDDPTITGHVSDQTGFELFLRILESPTGATIAENISAAVAADGSFQLNQAFLENHLGHLLPSGQYIVEISATDANLRTTDRYVAFSLHQVIPTVIRGISEDSGSSDTDGVTNDNRLEIVGTAAPFSSVSLISTSLGELGSTFAEGNGNWSVDATDQPLADGTYTWIALAEDSYLGADHFFPAARNHD